MKSFERLQIDIVEKLKKPALPSEQEQASFSSIYTPTDTVSGNVLPPSITICVPVM